MSLKQSDVVAMGGIAAGVLFPLVLIGAAYTLRTGNAEAELVFLNETTGECQVEVDEADSPQVIVVLRRDREPLTVIGHETKITRISGDVERVRLAAEELHLKVTQERLRVLSEDVQAGNNSIRQAVIEIDVAPKVEAARLGLLAEELRALERSLEEERSGEAREFELQATERYQAVASMLRERLEAESALSSADDQHKKKRKRRKRKHRRPC